jgi:hypothetical protein
MLHRLHAPLAPIVLGVIALLAVPTLRAQSSRDKSVWNYDGGVFLATEGRIPDGPCFYVKGRLTAPDFFGNLKRFDDDHGVVFRRGTETVTHFPDKLLLSFVIFDMPCSDKLQLQQTSTHAYLTRSQVSSLHVSMYWKHGVELRPAGKIENLDFKIERVAPYATALAAELPEKFTWSYEFAVLSASVPLTDSLVLVFRNTQGQTLARVAARL